MGEQMRNSNAKVFEVIIHIDGYDSILRPSMTTKNSIITEIIDSVLFIPIECVNVVDTINFVYTNGIRKQVIPGKTNETSIIILEGLNKGDVIYLIPPDDADEWSLKLLDKSIIEKYRNIKENDNKNDVTIEPKTVNRKGKGKRDNRKRPTN